MRASPIAGQTGSGPAATSASTAPRKVSAEELIGASGVLLIDHRGEEYRLRITSNGKLLLTK